MRWFKINHNTWISETEHKVKQWDDKFYAYAYEGQYQKQCKTLQEAKKFCESIVIEMMGT